MLTLPPLQHGDRLDQPAFHTRVQADHATAHADVVAWLGCHAMHTRRAEALHSATVILSDNSELQPDASLRVLANGQTSNSKDHYVGGCPELVCEIASSSASYDVHENLADYERYGAKEYVAVLVLEPAIHWFRRDDNGRLAEVPPGDDGIYQSTAFPCLWLDDAA